CRRPQNNEYKNSPASVNVPTNISMKRLITVWPRSGRAMKESTSRGRKQRGRARSNPPIPAQPQSETPTTPRLVPLIRTPTRSSDHRKLARLIDATDRHSLNTPPLRVRGEKGRGHGPARDAGR